MGKINLRWQTIIFFFEVAPDALYLKFCVNPGFKEMAVGFCDEMNSTVIPNHICIGGPF